MIYTEEQVLAAVDLVSARIYRDGALDACNLIEAGLIACRYEQTTPKDVIALIRRAFKEQAAKNGVSDEE
jgi:hypothetical protein